MSKRALANQEREQQMVRMSRLGRSTLLLIATLLSFATLGLLAADQLYRPDTFVIDQLKIKGKFRHLDPQDVELAVSELTVGNFFSVELDSIKRHIEQLQWVQQADVRREWPNTLLINITEHRPAMRWGKQQWINTVGQVITLPKSVSLPDPIVLHGNQRDAQILLLTAVDWKKRLNSLGLELKALSLSESNAWDLTIFDPLRENKFQLYLGREEVEQRLSRFEYLFAGEFRRANLKLERVDARYPDGLAINATEIKQSELEGNSELAMQHTVDQQNR